MKTIQRNSNYQLFTKKNRKLNLLSGINNFWNEPNETEEHTSTTTDSVILENREERNLKCGK